MKDHEQGCRILPTLGEIVGEARIATDEVSRRQAFQTLTGRLANAHARLPLGILAPSSYSELALIFGLLQKHDCPAAIVGHSLYPIYHPDERTYLALDLTRLDRVLKIDATSQLVTVDTAITLAELEQLLAAGGFTLRFTPTSHVNPTVGACLAQSEWGHQPGNDCRLAARFLSGTAVLPDGTLFTTKTTPRSAAGPDLDLFMVGNSALVHVWCLTTLMVFQRGDRRLWRCFQARALEPCLQACRTALQQGCDPVELEVTTRGTAEWYVAAGFEGIQEVVEGQETQFSSILLAHGLESLAGEQAKTVLQELPALLTPHPDELYAGFRCDWRESRLLWDTLRDRLQSLKCRWVISGMSMQQVAFHLYAREQWRDFMLAIKSLARALPQIPVPCQCRCPSVPIADDPLSSELLTRIKHGVDEASIMNPGALPPTGKEAS